MQFVFNLIGWNILTQMALIGCYFLYDDVLKTLYLIHAVSPGYFYFLIVSAVCLIWLAWTAVADLLGIRRLGAGLARAKARQPG